MPQEKLIESLQEAVLSVLTFDDKYGALIATQVTPEHFDGLFGQIAAPVLAYRARYGKAPGRAHLESLFSRAKLDPSDRKTHALRRTLLRLADEAETLNGEYVASRAQDFVRAQKLKSALLAANERYAQGGDEAVSEVESILSNALRFRADTLDAGVFLNDVDRALSFTRRQEEFYSLGIPQLDKLQIGMFPKQLLLYIAPKGCLAGNTLVDCPRDLSRYPQGIPIKELVGKSFKTYSWDFTKGRPVVSTVLDVWSSGVKPTYRATLSSKLRQKLGSRAGGSRRARYLPPLELVGTFDHPVLLADGTWRKLGELKAGDSLKSLYRRAESGKGGYSCLTWTARSRVDVREHRFVCSELFGEPLEGVHTHHKNGNSYDHTPENLEWKGAAEHWGDHQAELNRQGRRGWKVTGEHPRGMAGKKHSDVTRLKQKEASVVVAAGRQRNAQGHFVKRAPNHEVVSVEYVGEQEVFDMEVEGTSNFVANGVFVHNSGKTWFCVNAGRQAVTQKAKVLHVSLEMDEDRVLARYYQSFFAIARRPDPVSRATFELDELERLIGIKIRKSKPKLDFTDPTIRKVLRNKIKHWGTRFERLVIKKFSSGTLTLNQLRGYLDYLERVHKFVPNVLIIDYPMLMKMDTRDLRVSFGATVVGLRGLADERNLALIAPAQSNRLGIGAKRVDSRNAAEDISTVFTADTVLSYSQTKAEQRLGLARLSVEHARDTDTGMQLLLTQSYATGQYFVDSVYLSSGYWDSLKEIVGADDLKPDD